MHFLKAFQPQVSVIEVGENSYGHPNSDMIERLKDIGSKVFRTDLDGTIRFKVK
jgi:beta-lactamase superfamily II metal-dependent hydrolase